MREIITLQLGQKSNYVATHFWNLQESYFTYSDNEEPLVDHDVHFRQGTGVDGTETFMPRTLIYDLKGGFGTLRKYNALYDTGDNHDAQRRPWEGNQVIQREPEIPRNEYQKNLDLGLPTPQLTSESVRYWSDFNRLFYHPKSIFQLNDSEFDSQVRPFDNWSAGEDLFRSLDQEHDIIDSDFRPFIEECDCLGGIQLFSETDDAWGGFAARYVDRLKDEYGKTDIWFWGLENPLCVQQQKRSLKTANIARSIGEISSQTAAYIPVADPPSILPNYLNLDSRSEWCSSALVALAIESATLPTRLRSCKNSDSWLPWEENSRRIFNLQATIKPDDSRKPDSSICSDVRKLNLDEDDIDEALIKDYDLNYTPVMTSKGDKRHVFGQTRIARGVDEDRENNTYPDIQISRSGVVLQTYSTSLSFPILDSFPSQIFTNCSLAGSQMKVGAALSTTTDTRTRLDFLGKFVSKKAVGIDEHEALGNDLSEISEAYKYYWESDSESDDD